LVRVDLIPSSYVPRICIEPNYALQANLQTTTNLVLSIQSLGYTPSQ